MTALLYRFRVLGTLLLASLIWPLACVGDCLHITLRHVGFGVVCAWEDIRKYVVGAVKSFGAMYVHGFAAFKKGSKL